MTAIMLAVHTNKVLKTENNANANWSSETDPPRQMYLIVYVLYIHVYVHVD
jgi:hypothetical protein